MTSKEQQQYAKDLAARVARLLNVNPASIRTNATEAKLGSDLCLLIPLRLVEELLRYGRN